MQKRIVEPYRLFLGVGLGDLDKLLSKVRKMPGQTFRKGEAIAREGEAYPENPPIWLIEKGEVSLIKNDSSGKPQKVGVMEEGNTFGVENLMGKLSGLTTYPLTYLVSQNTEIRALSNEDLEQTLSKRGYTIVALNMTRSVSRWMRACLEFRTTVGVLGGYLKI
jgi:CRP-like cAMP-binding protein